MFNYSVLSSDEISELQFRQVSDLLVDAFPRQAVFFKANLKHTTSATFILASRKQTGSIVGFCSVHLFYRISGISTAVIEDVVVHPSCRQLGIGKMLISEAIEFSKLNAHKIMLQAHEDKVGFYRKHGFSLSDDLLTLTIYNNDRD